MNPIPPSGQRATPKIRTIPEPVPPHAEAPGSHPRQPAAERQTIRVLLVEDNAKLVDSLVRGLPELRYADIELDLTKRTAKRSGQIIPLTNKEFALLEFFMRRAGTTLSRAQIGEQVWDLNFDPSSNVIDVYVSMLRRKIDKGFQSALIHTVVGTGYVFADKPPA